MGEEKANSQKKQVKPHRGKLSVMLKGLIVAETVLGGGFAVAFSGPFSAGHILRVASVVVVISAVFVFLANFLIDRYVEQIVADYKQREEARISELALENKTYFLTNVSHEIRTPVNAVLGMNEMILRESKEDQIRRYAREIRTSGRTLLALIDDILDSTKLETGEMKIEPVEFDITDSVNDVVNLNAFRAKEKGLEFHTDFDPTTPRLLYGDEIRFKQILANLLHNAVKYTKEGCVDVSLGYEKQDETHVLLKVSVKDTGIGIKKEDLDKITMRFERLDEGVNRSLAGTGLGLNIVKELLALMGGELSVESEYGKGSVFTFEIVQQVINDTPIGDYNSRLEAARKAEDDHHANLYAPRARVLIVDDNEMNLEVITGLMEETGMQITTALSGRESIEILANNSFQIIFMDQMMPGMSGTEALKQIRNEHLCDDTPVIALTADAIVGARENYISEGFADYLAKPIMYPELEEMLKKYIPDDLKEKQKEKQVMLAVCRTPERLRQVKRILPKQYKGVFVRSNDQAEKYMKDHEVSFVIMDYETEKAKRE